MSVCEKRFSLQQCVRLAESPVFGCLKAFELPCYTSVCTGLPTILWFPPSSTIFLYRHISCIKLSLVQTAQPAKTKS